MYITILFSLLTLLICSPKGRNPNKPRYDELPSSAAALSLDGVNDSTVGRDVVKIINENDRNLREKSVLDTFLSKTFQFSGNGIIQIDINDRGGIDDAVIVDVHTQVLGGSQKKVNEGEREVVSVTSFEQKKDQSSNSRTNFGFENNGASVSNNAKNTVTIKDQVKSETIEATLRVCVTVTVKLKGPVDRNKTINKTLVYETTGSYTKTK